MASTTGTNGMALGNIPLNTLMLDKEAVVSVVEAQAEATMSGVQDIVDTAVSTVWKAGGSKTAAQLTTTLLVAANEGYVYNLTTDATTTADWAEGAGKTILAGTDVAVINTGTAAAPVYKFNALAARDASVVRKVNGQTPGSDGAVTIPNAGASTNGLMTSGQYKKLSGIASGAEVNQNAFSKIKVNGVSGTGDATSETDTLEINGSGHIGVTRFDKTVTIAFSGALVESVKIGEASYGISCGEIDITCGVVSGIVTDSGTASLSPSASGATFDIHGSSGIYVSASGNSVIVDGITLQSGIDAIDGAVSGLKNFSKVTVRNSAGSVVTNGTITPTSNADESLGFKAGSNVTLSTSGRNIVIAASQPSVPVTDVRINGSSLLSGTTADIPVGNLSKHGVVMLASAISGAVVGMPNDYAASVGLVMTRVKKAVLDGNITLVANDSVAPASKTNGSFPNTIYGLISAMKVTNDDAG